MSSPARPGTLCFFLLLCPVLAWPGGWDYRMPLAVREMSGTDLQEYQVHVDLDVAALMAGGKLRSDCGDLRIYDGGEELPAWIESCNGTARVWFRCNLTANGTGTFHVYYGNGNATARDRRKEVFLYYDGLESHSGIDTKSRGSGGDYIVDDCYSGNCLALDSGSNYAWAAVASKQRIPVSAAGYRIWFWMRFDDERNWHSGIVGLADDNTNCPETSDEGKLWQNAFGLAGTKEEAETSSSVRLGSWVDGFPRATPGKNVNYTEWGKYVVSSVGGATELDYGGDTARLESSPDFGNTSFYFAAYHLTYPGGLKSRMYLDEVHVAKLADPEPSYYFGEEQARYVETNRTPPEISIPGNFDLISYGGCVEADYSPEFFGHELTDFGFRVDPEFCAAGNYTLHAWAVDSFGNFTELNKTIYVGNATHSIAYGIPIQEFKINSSGEYPVSWEASIDFQLEGYASGNLSFRLSVFGLDKVYNFTASGPWSTTVVDSLENETVEVEAVRGECNHYSLSRNLEMHAYLLAPEYDPRTRHATGSAGNETFAEHGTFLEGGWWVEYDGNGTSFEVCSQPGREPGFKWCGDSECGSGESCSSCPGDCGACRSNGKTVTSSPKIIDEPRETENLTIQPDVEPEENETGPEPLNMSPGSRVSVDTATELWVAPGLALSDGEKLYVGEVTLEAGEYEVVNVSRSVPAGDATPKPGEGILEKFLGLVSTFFGFLF